jgi:hypothetical protein
VLVKYLSIVEHFHALKQELRFTHHQYYGIINEIPANGRTETQSALFKWVNSTR